MTPVSEGALQGRRALVAEHEASARWSYVGLLRGAGARVTEARDGLEALELARALQPDLIVAGVAMPKLGGRELIEALRGDALEAPAVVLVAEGRAPEAVPGRDPALADDVLAVLGTPTADPPASGVVEPQPRIEAHGPERENIRAQSTVAMYRDPANRVRRGSHPIWRLRGNGTPSRASRASGFELDLRTMSRVLGTAFVTLILGTVALVAWSEVVSPRRVAEPPPTPIAPPSVAEPRAAQPEPPPEPPRRAGLEAFSGTLRAGVEPSLTLAAGQGVLELAGPEDVQVRIDGIDRGGLPLSIVLDEGIHSVRYTFEGSSSDRYYLVKSGFTRSLRIITRPGGFVDAR